MNTADSLHISNLFLKEFNMEINHSFDLAPDLGTPVEVLDSANYFVQAVDVADGGFDCGGTFGSAGSFGGTLGSVGSFGCCC